MTGQSRRHAEDRRSESVEETEDQLQREVLLTYWLLAQDTVSWAARLILLIPDANRPVTRVHYAGLLLGALSLTLSENAEGLKNGVRFGAFDFLVNTLDEALRILKNEARKHAPVSVALFADATKTAEELLNRGVAPAVLMAAHPEMLHRLASNAGTAGQLIGGEVLHQQEPLSGSALYRLDFHNASARREFDGRAASLLRGAGKQMLARWLEAAERVLPRSVPIQRFLVLSPREADLIGELLAGLVYAKLVEPRPEGF